MEKLIADIEAYATAVGVSPSTVIQKAGVGSGSTWRRWRDGESSPTLATVDRLKAYIVANPAPTETTETTATEKDAAP